MPSRKKNLSTAANKDRKTVVCGCGPNECCRVCQHVGGNGADRLPYIIAECPVCLTAITPAQSGELGFCSPACAQAYEEIGIPQAPADLWQQMDALIDKPTIAANAFTRAEFQRRYGMKKDSAQKKLTQLVEEGSLIVQNWLGRRYYSFKETYNAGGNSR